MSDVELFGKLSRVFETHQFSTTDKELTEILEDFDPTMVADYRRDSAVNISTKDRSRLYSPVVAAAPKSSEKPTPYEVWREKNKDKFIPKKQNPKLNGQQWDKLVDKMYHSNRVKQSALIKEQNDGLASELESFSFRPRINQTSLDLSATMKSLSSRIPELVAEKDKLLEAKRRELKAQEVAECSFKPKRGGAKLSDLYLKKMGRSATVRADDLLRYRTEREIRNSARKQIIDEIEERELTFKPHIGEKSSKLQEKLRQSGAIDIDPITRHTVLPPPSPLTIAQSDPTLAPVGSRRRQMDSALAETLAAQFEQGPLLQIESEHPYRHNMNEYTTVSIPGAVSYSIKFHESTRTEPIYDYLKFFDDDTHTQYFGAGKYSGGSHGSPCNWPGLGTRPPLIIPASRFVIHFKTNGTVNDWGFCMQITPTLNNSVKQYHLENSICTNIPKISDTAKGYRSPAKYAMDESGRYSTNAARPVPVHHRLYKEAVEKSNELHNAQVDLLQSKLNISLKPWENVRSSKEGQNNFIKLNNTTHLPKYTIADIKEKLIAPDQLGAEYGDSAEYISVSSSSNPPGGGKKFAVVEFDESMTLLWRKLRAA